MPNTNFDDYSTTSLMNNELAMMDQSYDNGLPDLPGNDGAELDFDKAELEFDEFVLNNPGAFGL